MKNGQHAHVPLRFLERRSQESPVCGASRVWKPLLRLRRALAIVTAMMIAGSVAIPAGADDRGWVWCSGLSVRTAYFSEVFQDMGGHFDYLEYKNAFSSHVSARYENVSPANVFCFSEKSKSAARSKRDAEAASNKANFKVVFTDWEY